MKQNSNISAYFQNVLNKAKQKKKQKNVILQYFSSK